MPSQRGISADSRGSRRQSITKLGTAEDTDRPISVLLVGRTWNVLSSALTALSNSGRILVVGPATVNIETVLADRQPSLILVGPDARHSPMTKLGTRHEGQAPQSPILLCVTHQDLEKEESYADMDDFVVVPCSAAELYQRMRRLVTKVHGSVPSSSLQVGSLALDLSAYRVTADGKTVGLTWTEFQLLKFLMQNPGRVFPRIHLLTSVWGAQNSVRTRTVDVYIRRLRHKLGAPGGALFRTVKNVGYGIVESE